MKSLILVVTCVVSLSGCVSYHRPVPEGYSGPRAQLHDSVKVHSASKADFFYVSHVDGQQIEDTRIKTRVANRGHGFNMTPVVVQRDIPVRELTLTIVGRTDYAAPILTLTSTVYQVKGDIRFTPIVGKSYVVRGELGEAFSAVWIEGPTQGIVPGTKVEIKGPATLGVFEK